MKSILLLLLFLLTGCMSCHEKAAWKIAQTAGINSNELIKFLNHYKTNQNIEKYKAACFLIENMPNKYSISKNKQTLIYDIDIIKADSLIQSLEYSFELKDNCPFLKDYTFEQFCEYILPYRIANEPLQYYWKWDCIKRFGNGNSTDMIKAAQNINTQIKIELSPDFYKDPLKSYSSLLQTGYGKCDDRSTLAIMALRSAGIPAAFEFIPYWGSSNNGHSFVSVILPNDSIISFQNNDKERSMIPSIRKTPKIYRKIYSITSRKRYNNKDNYPKTFANCDIIDVTEKYAIGMKNVIISDSKITPIYLSVFSPNGWIPVAIHDSGNFQHVGTGIIKEKNESEEALNLGNGILYLPSIYKDNKITPISVPIIVSNNSIHKIHADTIYKETIILERKFPLNKRIITFARNMLNGVFEGANNANFSDAQKLYCISQTPFSRLQKINIHNNKSYRYIRYRCPNQRKFSIAEFNIYDTNGVPIKFRPIVCKGITSDEDIKKIFDSNPLTYFEVDGVIDLWVGVELMKKQKIGYIEFAPRNDDNAIVANDLYELFYWNNRWISLGRKTTNSHIITYMNVPNNALLWLRNLTKGHEERPFTYENNRQIWW